MMKNDKKFQAEMDLETLISAEKIKKDKARLSEAMKMKDQKMKMLSHLDKKEK